jgi:hypothetical protein
VETRWCCHCWKQRPLTDSWVLAVPPFWWTRTIVGGNDKDDTLVGLAGGYDKEETLVGLAGGDDKEEEMDYPAEMENYASVASTTRTIGEFIHQH